MKILFVHNAYRERSGEEAVLDAEVQLLRAAGHSVVLYSRDNREISAHDILKKAALVPRTIWAWDSYRELKAVLAEELPDLVHFHNTFPLISPAAYYACRAAGVPVIQTLHNYRLLCARATLFRNGNLCEVCLGKAFPWPAIIHACYRRSHIASATTVALLAVHRAMQTWSTKVDAFISPSELAKEKFVQGGLPAERIFVKPNFVFPDPCPRDSGASPSNGEYAIFVGRLNEEKGLRTLLKAWRLLEGRIPLRILGSGPLFKELKAASKELEGISLIGHVNQKKVFDALRGARFLVFPSEWSEPFGCVVAESFACGIPAIAARCGPIQHMVRDHVSGIQFKPGDAEDLAAKVRWAWTHPKEIDDMGKCARAEYEAKYSAKHNYELLMQIYNRVLEDRKAYSNQVKYDDRRPVVSVTVPPRS